MITIERLEELIGNKQYEIQFITANPIFGSERMCYYFKEELEIYTRLRDYMVQESEIKAKEKVKDAFLNDYMGIYREFMKRYGQKVVRIDVADGKAMKSIKSYLLANCDGNEEAALQSWAHVLGHWGRLNDFLQQQKRLIHINKNLVEIIDKLKNGTNKQDAQRNGTANMVADILNKRY